MDGRGLSRRRRAHGRARPAAGRRRRGRLVAGIRHQRGGARHARAGDRARRLHAGRRRRRSRSTSRRPSSAATAATGSALDGRELDTRRHGRACCSAGSSAIRSCRSRTRSPRTTRRACVAFTAAAGERVQVIGDDYLVTNAAAGRRRPQRAARCNAVLDQAQPGRHDHRDQGRARRRQGAPASAPSSRRAPARPRMSRSSHLAVGWNAGPAQGRLVRALASAWRNGTRCCASRKRSASKPASPAPDAHRLQSLTQPDREPGQDGRLQAPLLRAIGQRLQGGAVSHSRWPRLGAGLRRLFQGGRGAHAGMARRASTRWARRRCWSMAAARFASPARSSPGSPRRPAISRPSATSERLRSPALDPLRQPQVHELLRHAALHVRAGQDRRDTGHRVPARPRPGRVRDRRQALRGRVHSCSDNGRPSPTCRSRAMSSTPRRPASTGPTTRPVRLERAHPRPARLGASLRSDAGLSAAGLMRGRRFRPALREPSFDCLRCHPAGCGLKRRAARLIRRRHPAVPSTLAQRYQRARRAGRHRGRCRPKGRRAPARRTRGRAARAQPGPQEERARMALRQPPAPTAGQRPLHLGLRRTRQDDADGSLHRGRRRSRRSAGPISTPSWPTCMSASMPTASA